MSPGAIHIDRVSLDTWLAGLLRDGETCVLEDIGHRIADLPRDRLAGFLDQFVKPAYGTVNRAGQRVAELRFVLPARADQLLAALRAYETNGDSESREISSLSTFDEAGK